MSGIVIQPGPDWTTQDFINAYSNLADDPNINRNDAGNTVLAAMIGQGLNPQLSESALYNVAPFDASVAIESGANSVGQNLNSQDASQPWYRQVWYTGGITKDQNANQNQICLDGLCFTNPFASQPTNKQLQQDCSALDVVCKIKAGGEDLIAIILGFICIIFAMVMLATGKGITDSADHIVTRSKAAIETVAEAAA